MARVILPNGKSVGFWLGQDSKLLVEGDFVVGPFDIGLLSAGLDEEAEVLVQFGAGGPFARLDKSQLRPATPAEIVEAGWEGVGCNQAMDWKTFGNWPGPRRGRPSKQQKEN